MEKILKIKNSIKQYPVVFVFSALCICMLTLYLLLPDNDFSQMENRYLQMRPHLSLSGLLDGSYMEAFETYTNEQIPMRNILVRCKAVIVWLTGSSENDGIAKGRDGYLFDKVLATDDKVRKNITAIREFAAGTDRDIYIAVAPTSTLINEDRLPEGMPVLDERSCGDFLEDALAGQTNAHIIDLYDALYPHRSQQLYYRTDHHWTTLGAGYAYSAITSCIGIPAGDIEEYEKHTVNGFYGTHYAKYKGFATADELEYYDVPIKELELEKRTVDNLMDKDKLKGYDKYAAFMYGNDGRYVVRTGNDTGRDLYILKDSYANCLIPYLVMNYDNITVMDLRYFGGSVSEEIDKIRDADVLLLYNWTFVNEDNHFYKLVGK